MLLKLKRLFHRSLNLVTTKTVSDEYINWLTYANAGMLAKGNVYAMRHAIENLPSDSPVVEIGSFCGLSTNVMSYLLTSQGKKNKIISCDRWIFENSDRGDMLGNSQIPRASYREFVKSTFMRNVEFFSANNKPHTIEETSDEFFASWSEGKVTNDVFGRRVTLGGKISFCFIDGNHTYDFAKRDFENADRYLESGGFVLFDDSTDDDPFGLTRLMREVQRNKNYQLVMKNPNYLFKRV